MAGMNLRSNAHFPTRRLPAERCLPEKLLENCACRIVPIFLEHVVCLLSVLLFLYM